MARYVLDGDDTEYVTVPGYMGSYHGVGALPKLTENQMKAAYFAGLGAAAFVLWKMLKKKKKKR